MSLIVRPALAKPARKELKMEVFVHRQPKGYLTKDLEDINELGELLTNYGPLGEDNEVTVEITASWREIKGVLAMAEPEGIWFNPQTDPRLKE